MNRILLLPLVFSMAACATTSNQTLLQRADKIAVVATFDDKLPVLQVGTSTKESRADIQDWNLNQKLTTDIQAELTKMNKSAFPLVVDFNKINQGKEEALNLKNLYLGNRYQILEQYLVTQAEEQGAKYLFILHPFSSEHFPQHKAGYGFFCQSSRGMKGNMEAYGYLRLAVWNIQTKQVDARVTLSPAEIAYKTGKSCAEINKMPADKIAALYKEQLMTLLKISTDIALSGINTPQGKQN